MKNYSLWKLGLLAVAGLIAIWLVIKAVGWLVKLAVLVAVLGAIAAAGYYMFIKKPKSDDGMP